MRAARILATVLLLGVGCSSSRVGPSPKPPPTRTVSGSATRVVNGVPVGYPHTRAGATAAATTFNSLRFSELLLEPDRYRAAIETLAAPEGMQGLLVQAEENLEALEGQYQLLAKAAQGIPVAIRSVPFTYKLESYDDAAARVRIWGSTVIAVEGSRFPVQVWETAVVDLTWVGQDWRMLKADRAENTTVPFSAFDPTSSASLSDELRDFKQYVYVPR